MTKGLKSRANGFPEMINGQYSLADFEGDGAFSPDSHYGGMGETTNMAGSRVGTGRAGGLSGSSPLVVVLILFVSFGC